MTTKMELFWSFELHWILNCRPDSSLTSSLAGEILNCQPCTEHILLLGLHLEPNWGCWHIEPFKEGSSLAVDIFCLSVLDPRMPHTMVIKSTRTLYSELERYQAIRQKLSPIFVVNDFFCNRITALGWETETGGCLVLPLQQGDK